MIAGPGVWILPQSGFVQQINKLRAFSAGRSKATPVIEALAYKDNTRTMEYIIGVVFILFLVVMAFSVLKKKSQVETRNKLECDGYVHIFHGSGDPFIAFNIQNGKIRFGNLAANTYVERPVSFITNHEWKWVERDAQKHSNKFLFYMSDVKYFMHEVFYCDESRRAEIEWAKLQAVINECVSYQYVQVECVFLRT